MNHDNQSFKGLSLENSVVLVPLVTFNFLSLLSFIQHHLDNGVVLSHLQLGEHVVLPEMFDVPLVQFQDIRDAVDSTLRFEQVGIL